VVEAGSQEEALQAATDLQPHLILLDNGVTGLDMPAFMQTIQTELPATQVVILSTYDVDVYREAALASGAIEFVPKADLIDRLVAVLRTH
jgi:DNA-binding NarL/FixJ family response regulator